MFLFKLLPVYGWIIKENNILFINKNFMKHINKKPNNIIIETDQLWIKYV